MQDKTQDKLIKNKYLFILFLISLSPIIAYMLDYAKILLFIIDNIWMFLITVYIIFLSTAYLHDIRKTEKLYFLLFIYLSIFTKSTLYIVCVFYIYGQADNLINKNYDVLTSLEHFTVNKNSSFVNKIRYMYENEHYFFYTDDDFILYSGYLIKKELFFRTYKSIYICEDIYADKCLNTHVKELNEIKIIGN